MRQEMLCSVSFEWLVAHCLMVRIENSVIIDVVPLKLGIPDQH
jgi:hypothetical protein